MRRMLGDARDAKALTEKGHADAEIERSIHEFRATIRY